MKNFSFDDLDFNCVVVERDATKLHLESITDELSKALEQKEDLLKLFSRYLAEKRICEKAEPEMRDGKPTGRMLTPLASAQNFRSYKWLKNYLPLAVYKGWENSQNFLARSCTDEQFFKEADLELDGLKRTSHYVEILKFLKIFRLPARYVPKSQSSTVAE